MDVKDVALHKGLVHLLNTGKFELQSRDIQGFVTILKWVEGIPKMVNASDELSKAASTPVSEGVTQEVGH